MDLSVTIILSFYKRPHTLIHQLETIYNQSAPIERVIIWVNKVKGIEFPQLPDNLMKNTTIISSTENYGVWGRFLLGFLSESKYICIFDDDIIPGKDYIKNCLDCNKIHEGLYGPYGIIFAKGSNYNKCTSRPGWHNPNNNIQKVDFVGHSWFFKREWLSILWKMPPPFSRMINCGEDMGISYYFQKAGINTFVPPHPENNKDLWGCLPEFGLKYGCDDVAISMNPQNIAKFNVALKYYISLGYKLINNERLYGKAIEHLDYFIDKINKKENFGLIRPSDGEYLVLIGNTFTNIDNWTFINDKPLLKINLNSALEKGHPNVYCGIPCNTCCNTEWFNFYTTKYKNFRDFTYANIFVNACWEKWTEFLKTHNGFYLISSSIKLNSFKIKDQLVIDAYLVNTWTNDSFAETNRVLDFIRDKKNELILFSAGPLSKIWIIECMHLNPDNIYLDIGSSLDYFLKDKNQRLYTNKTNEHAYMNCSFIYKYQFTTKTEHINSIDQHYLLNILDQYDVSTSSLIHQICCEQLDEDYKNNLNQICKNVLYTHSIERENSLHYDPQIVIIDNYQNYFDFVIFIQKSKVENISTVIKNLLMQIKSNGSVIIMTKLYLDQIDELKHYIYNQDVLQVNSYVLITVFNS